MSQVELRERLATLAEQIITLLDLIDGDPDFEDDTVEEEEDQDSAPVTLCPDRNIIRRVA